MGSINLLSFNAQSFCCQLTRQHQEEKEKSLLETPRFEPRAAGREASMLSTVLCGPPALMIKVYLETKDTRIFHSRSETIMILPYPV